MADSLEYAFEPQTIKLNDEDFVVELKPTCKWRYDDVSYERDAADDGPTWDNFWGERCYEPPDGPITEAESVVEYVSWKRTIIVALVGSNFAEVPVRIKVANAALGFQGDAVLVVNGRAVKARGLRICETTPEDKLAIEKEREALAVVAAEREALARQHAVDVVESDSEANAASSAACDTVAASDAIRGEEEGEAEAPQRAVGTDDPAQANGAPDAGKIEQNKWNFGDLTIEKRGDEPYVKFGNGKSVALKGQCRQIVNAMLCLKATSVDEARNTKDILGAARILSEIRLRTPFLAPGDSKTVRKKLWKNYFHQVGEGKKGKPYQYYLGLVPSTNADATATEGA